MKVRKLFRCLMQKHYSKLTRQSELLYKKKKSISIFRSLRNGDTPLDRRRNRDTETQTSKLECLPPGFTHDGGTLLRLKGMMLF